MIPFEEIDSRLEKLKKDRVWLAENTPYSADYIRTVLAPKSTRRTPRVQQVLSDAIEREEASRKDPQQFSSSEAARLDYIAIEVDSKRMDSYQEAAKTAVKTLKEWTISELDRAAEEWARKKGGPRILPDAEADEDDQAGNGG